MVLKSHKLGKIVRLYVYFPCYFWSVPLGSFFRGQNERSGM